MEGINNRMIYSCYEYNNLLYDIVEAMWLNNNTVLLYHQLTNKVLFTR